MNTVGLTGQDLLSSLLLSVGSLSSLGVNIKLCGRGEVDCASVCVWTLTVIAKFDVAGSNCLM